MEILLDDKNLSYSGRIDFENPKKPQMIFPSSNLRFSFIGKSAKIVVENHRVCWNNSLGAIVDGKEYKFRINNEGMTEIVLVDSEENEKHEIMLFKRMDSCHVITLHSLEISDNSVLLPKKEPFKRRIEVYGDSVSAGEVSEAEEYVGKCDPEDHEGEKSNSYYSYPWIFARKVDADLHNIAQGGIPLMKGTGWIEPDYIGMEDIWDKVHYQTSLNKLTNWDFSKYTPQLVIVAVGQNCANPINFMEEEPQGERAKLWKSKYKKLVLDIRSKYPNATILLTTTILMHHKNWDEAIDDVCVDINDNKVIHFMYSRNGMGTPGHIRGSEAEEMASELEKFVNELDFDIWCLTEA